MDVSDVVNGGGEVVSDVSRLPQSAQLVEIALDKYDFILSTSNEVYATSKNGVMPGIVYSLKGNQEALRARLSSDYYDLYSKPPTSAALKDCLTTIEGKALDNPREVVSLRVCNKGNTVYYDPGDSTGDIYAITRHGWVKQPNEVYFRRTELTGEQVTPVSNGSFDLWRKLVNIDDDNFRLVIAWCVACFILDIPHPILTITGRQGTAKTSFMKQIVALVDPSKAATRPLPSNDDSWYSQVSASWVVSFDNLSYLPRWQQDAMCRTVTQDSFAKRALYTNEHLVVKTYRACIIITGIDLGSIQGDVSERMACIELEPIDANNRRSEADINRHWNIARPYALSALFSLVAKVLDIYDDIELDAAPRMADFARVCACVDKINGWNTLSTYIESLGLNERQVIDSDPFGSALVEYIDQYYEFTGTVSDLSDAIAPDKLPKGWPVTAQGVTGKLKRLAPALKVFDIEVEQCDRSSSKRLTRVYKTNTDMSGLTPCLACGKPSKDTLHPSCKKECDDSNVPF